MLPPNSDCSPPNRLPTIERERTVMPRTTPRLLTILYPGSASAVVTMASFIGHPCSNRSSICVVPATHRRMRQQRLNVKDNDSAEPVLAALERLASL